ncbi:hypothetical protein [Streptomyces justiciae]|uniref:hypothetical protein n=1 Tax=Streptomyces justiciae TaxID=2780140 RepID=UPI002117A33B|nr:hypothetical protein [Streptomyces justiciae]MCW8375488.1 hypothetical protein [Streptomyces justiciae]
MQSAEWGELATLAEDGVLLTSRALAAGWSRVPLSRRLSAEGWTRVRNGAWVEPGREVDVRLRLKAFQLLEPRLVVSHRSAARIWRIEVLDTGVGRQVPKTEAEFTDPERTSQQRGPGVRVHRIPVAEADVVQQAGLRVTDVPRTLADLLRAGPRDDALVAVESALGYRSVDGVRRPPLTTWAALSISLEPPLRGATRARQWLRLADRGAGSPAETVARLRMLDAGLRPETQAEIHIPGGRRRFLDFFFRRAGLAVEIEGYAYHGTREAHRRDITRFNDLLRSPQIRTVLRFTAEDVFHHPTHMLTQIRAALG